MRLSDTTAPRALSADTQILLIDEAQKIQTDSYDLVISNATICDLIEKVPICVFFCDPNQITQRYDDGTLNTIENEALKLNANFELLELLTQYRCNGSSRYLDWLFSILEMDADMQQFVLDNDDFHFTICDRPSEVIFQIRKKQEEGLSARVVMGNCYDRLQTPDGNVLNDNCFNWELTECKKPNKWAIDSAYNHSVGQLFHCAGLEFDYIGVIIGPDLFYRNGKVMADSRNRSLKKDYDFIERLNDYSDFYFHSEDYIFRIKNIYYTLLTRGMRGCYVYFCDENLANYFRRYLSQSSLDTKKQAR